MTRRIVYCHCAFANVVPAKVKQEVLAGLAASGEAFEAVPDLCRMAADRDPALGKLAEGDDRLVIAACYPRAVKWIFHGAGVTLPDERVTVVNMREGTGAEALAKLDAKATA